MRLFSLGDVPVGGGGNDLGAVGLDVGHIKMRCGRGWFVKPGDEGIL